MQRSIFVRRAALAAFFLVVSHTVCSQTSAPKATLKGHVGDFEGAAIKGARIFVVWDSSGSLVGVKDNVGTPEQRSAIAEEGGNYSVELPPGFYDVFVSAGAFSPGAAKVRLRAGDNNVHNAKLHVDPIVSRELSGTRVNGASKR